MEKRRVSRKAKIGIAAGALIILAAGISVYAVSSGPQENITEAEAKQIALAEVKGADVSNITGFRKDIDNNRVEYDVEIIYDGFEYDFEISAKNGKIFDRNKEIADAEDLARLEAQKNESKAVEQAEQNKNVVIDGGSGNAVSGIRLEKAESIALGQVPGAGHGDIVRAYQDNDDGRVEFDIKIRYDGYEYEFEIDGSSGKVISKDVDRIEYDDVFDD